MPRDEIQVAEVADAKSFAARFASALLDPALPSPACVRGPRFKAVTSRYNVYRNNVTVSLINALAAVFPATKNITGDDFFRAMARFYLRAQPPISPLLFEYGRDFPDFIEQYQYARPVPWLADVARIERAWLDAYHAADAEPLAPQALASIPPERLADTVLIPHPATRVLRSRFAALTMFSAHKGDAAPSLPSTASEEGKGGGGGEPEDTLVTRPDLEVVATRLPPGGATFLARLIAGDSLGAAAAQALAECPSFDLSGNIAGFLEAGAFVAANSGESNAGS
jgi:hypothetical protein